MQLQRYTTCKARTEHLDDQKEEKQQAKNNGVQNEGLQEGSENTARLKKLFK